MPMVTGPLGLVAGTLTMCEEIVASNDGMICETIELSMLVGRASIADNGRLGVGTPPDPPVGSPLAAGILACEMMEPSKLDGSTLVGRASIADSSELSAATPVDSVDTPDGRLLIAERSELTAGMPLETPPGAPVELRSVVQ